MPQRTIAEARAQLDALGQVMSNASLEPFRAELEAAQAVAQEMATRHMDTTSGDAEKLAADVLDQLSEVQDAYAELVSASEAGRVSARDFSDRFTKLRAQQRAAERRSSELMRTADRLEAIESAPEAWADGLYSRFPLVRPEFSF